MTSERPGVARELRNWGEVILTFGLLGAAACVVGLALVDTAAERWVALLAATIFLLNALFLRAICKALALLLER